MMTFPFERPLDDVAYVEIPVSGITTNVYAVGPPGETLIIDTGGGAFAAEIVETLQSNGCAAEGVRAIVVTHGHLDHYGGAAALSAWSGAPVWAHLHAAANIEDHWSDFIAPRSPAAKTNAAAWKAFQEGAGDEVRVARMLREGDTIDHAGRRLDVLHLPGHQRGLITLFEPDRRLAFVGDLIQGGADCSANWLGLFEDVAGQRRSLDRLASLDPAWLFRGHREPQSGDGVAPDLAAARKRLDDIEQALREALAKDAPLSAAQAVRAAFKAVLGMDVEKPAPYAVRTVTAFFVDLAQRGLARQTRDLEWEPVGE